MVIESSGVASTVYEPRATTGRTAAGYGASGLSSVLASAPAVVEPSSTDAWASRAVRHGASDPGSATTAMDRTLFGDKPLASPALGRYRTAPNSMRPRIGSGVSNAPPENCAFPYWYASADIVKISAKNPPCEPASSGTRSRAEKTGILQVREDKETPFSCGPMPGRATSGNGRTGRYDSR